MLTQRTLLAASHRSGLRRLVTGTTTTRRVVDRFVAGESLADVLEVVRTLTGQGMSVTLDHLGEEVTDRTEARRSRDAYLTALDGLAPLKLGCRAEVSVKLSAFGQGLANGGHDLALGLVRPVVAAAATQGTTVTLDMEDSRTVDSTLAVLGELREQYPGTGAVLQAMLRRTEEDAALLAGPASRVRLVKGAYRETPAAAFQDRAGINAAYARCMEILMAGKGYPMVGTHDPRLIERARQLAIETGRSADSWEFQMLYGIRPQEQQRLVSAGCHVRAYVPYGVDWYSYFMRRLAERPANLRFFLRSLATKS